MTYNPNIPATSDNLSTSQGQMLSNFSQLNTIFDHNHFTWDNATSANRGLHRKVDFPVVQGSDPSPTGAAGVVYSKALSGLTQLFFANASQVTQLTGTNSIGASGSVTIQGGLILKWGTSAFSGSSTSLTVSLPVAFPNNCYFATSTAVTTTGVAANVTTTQISGLTQLLINRAGGTGLVTNMSVQYFAIGN